MGGHLAVVTTYDCWLALEGFLQGGGGSGSLPMFTESQIFHTCGTIQSISGNILTVLWSCDGACQGGSFTTQIDLNVIPSQGNPVVGRCILIHYKGQGVNPPNPIDPNNNSDKLELNYAGCQSPKKVLCQATCTTVAK
ncbi:uncharacterized protein LOC106160224 [Lingula anatina]|uniref:Uncharacterized protein LOC106160224 n=1 Tax=Lingula anatina TaxID=7574 RepID=A0A1S3I1U0_LINAN|nr:uncharacterized protein LOC106160224 [Lingula anatina]|eukprot:XP_013392213.1 uncharacterized protein LOC106160224 [Lingula anatina]